MITNTVELKMPFKYGFIFREKKIPFLFKIMTLEMTCDHMGVEFGEMFAKNKAEADIYQSLIWNGYLAACMVLHKKPRYDELQSHFWAEYMSADTRKALVAEVTKLMTYLSDSVRTTPEEAGEKGKKP